MAVSRRSVDSLARRAGRRAITRGTRADLDDAMADLDHLATEILTVQPAEQADAFLAALESLADDVERILTRGRL